MFDVERLKKKSFQNVLKSEKNLLLEWEEFLFEFYQDYIWTKHHSWPLGADSFTDPIDSSLERPDVFKFGLPDHFGKVQASCEEEMKH